MLTSGPGKTALLYALAKRVYRFAPESSRYIIKKRLALGRRLRSRSRYSVTISPSTAMSLKAEVAFFDRRILDAQSALTRDEIAHYVRVFPYRSIVFLLPPWKDIYSTDSERDQTFVQAVEVFEGMKSWYQQWSYEKLEFPRGSIEKRVSYI